MNIGIVTSFFSDGNEEDTGIGIHFRDLALGLKSHGHTVEVFHFPYDFLVDNIACFNGIKVKRIGIAHPQLPKLRGIGRLCNLVRFFDFYECICLYRRSKRLADELLKFQCDVVDATSNRGVAYGLSRNDKRPPIFTRVSTTMRQSFAHEKKIPDFNFRLSSRFEEMQIQNSEHLVTHTKNHAHEISKIHNISYRQFSIIPHAIDTNELDSFFSKSDNDSSIQVLFVGRLEHRKGYDVLLKAIPAVLNKKANVKFNFCGKITEEAKTEIKNLEKWKNNVHFHGYQDRKSLVNFYKSCDIFVAPSRYESFGIIYLEAMKFGKPVVACNSGGTPEVIFNNSNGLLIEPGDHEQLASVLINLCENKSLRQNLGQNGRKKVEELFSLNTLVESTTENYRKALSSKTSS